MQKMGQIQGVPPSLHWLAGSWPCLPLWAIDCYASSLLCSICQLDHAHTIIMFKGTMHRLPLSLLTQCLGALLPVL